MFARRFAPICRQLITDPAIQNNVRKAHSVVPKDAKPLMDTLPIPEGCWQEYYNKQNAKYNMHLILGIVTFAVTFGVGYSSGLFFINLLPPPLPEKEIED